MKVAVLGAGISGLTAAWRLEQAGVDYTVFEASSRAGGAIGSTRRDGFIAERGPHTFLNSQAVFDAMIGDLGLEEKRLWANAQANKRYTVKDGRAVALPMSPADFFSTDLFSGAAKAALLREPFVPPRHDEVDESVTSFVKRRLGQEFLDYGVDLLVNGIWAGDPNRLSMRHAFKKMWALEAAKGSIFKGGIAAGRDKTRRKGATRIFAFEGGNQTLVDALVARVRPVFDAPVVGLKSVREGWSVKVGGKNPGTHRFDHVISTMPADALASALPVEETRLVAERLNYPAVAVCTFGFKRSDVGHPLDGFGMLVPQVEGRNILGVMFTSTLFDGRAPSDHVTMAVFVGGMRHGEKAQMEPGARREMVLAELKDLLGVRGAPVFEHAEFWARAIPQYEVGHGDVLVWLQALERKHSGLWVSGNFRNAVAVPDLVLQGVEVAERVLKH